MSSPQEDLLQDSLPDGGFNPNESFEDNGSVTSPSSPPVIHRTTIINVTGGSNINLQVGNGNSQQHHLSHLSKSLENLQYCCENCGSTGTSPVTTINRSHSTDFLDKSDDQWTQTDETVESKLPQRTVGSLIKKFEGGGASSPSIPVRHKSLEMEDSANSPASESYFVKCLPSKDSVPEIDGFGPGEYTWQDDNSSCSSFTGPDSTDSASTSSDPPSLPRRRKITSAKPKLKPKPLIKIATDDDEYISMDGSCNSLNSVHSLPQLPRVIDRHSCKKSGENPKT